MSITFERASGILLHPTSLPGPFGIGDFGPDAYHWIDFLSEAGCSLWQILPLGPTGYGDSPYQCFSAVAGNPFLINPALLIEDGFLAKNDLIDQPEFCRDQVDYGLVIPWKLKILERAFNHFKNIYNPALTADYDKFHSDASYWLDDFALFMSLKEANQGASWQKWDKDLRERNPKSLLEAKKKLSNAIQRQIFQQFIFFRQWQKLRAYAHNQSVRIIGDIPIFVAHDSAEVWAKPSLFLLDQQGAPTFVAGVPPDYFSSTGQLWGNPLYHWDIHAQSGYTWWLERLRSTLDLVDIIRLDHFRGFDAYWEVPAQETTAVNGRWAPGPGLHFFNKIFKTFGSIPIIAEDLGVITPQVNLLRDKYNLPGMKVLVFAFNSGSSNPYLPHNFEKNCVVYTGTHDNDTTRGWYDQASPDEQDFTNRYLNISGTDSSNISWRLIRAAWSSVAGFAIAPLQDILGLGNEARMNYPSSLGNNWKWRVTADALTDKIKLRLLDINNIFGRKRI